MTLALRHRPVRPSPLGRWDARWKLAALLPAAAVAASLDRLAPAAVAVLVAGGLVALGRVPLVVVRDRTAALLVAVVPFAVVLPFTLDGPGWTVGPVTVSDRGLTAAAGVGLRCFAVAGLFLAVAGSAPAHHTMAAAHRIGVPGVLVRVALLAYRYAFLLAAELRRLRVAVRVRGFRPRADAHGRRTVGHLTGAVLVRGADRADRVAEAMRCRGFDGAFHSLDAFRTTPADVLAFAAVLSGTIALVAWDRL